MGCATATWRIAGGGHWKPLENRAAHDMDLCPQWIERTMNASLEATPECLYSDSEHVWQAGSQFLVLPVSEAAVRRPFQAWHNVHAHGQCPFREPEGFRIVFESCIISLRRDSQASVSGGGLACLAGNILPRAAEAMGSCRRGTRMCPRVSGASDLSHWRVHFLPLWSRTGLPQEVHVETWAHHFTTETAAKKVPIAGGNPVCPVLKQPGKGWFFQLK